MALIARPYTFTDGTPADAVQVNANENLLYSTINGGLDSTNINAAIGLVASLIKPTTSGNATFGGSQAYTFPSPLTVTDNNGAAGGPLLTMTSDAAWGNPDLSFIWESVAATGRGGELNLVDTQGATVLNISDTGDNSLLTTILALKAASLTLSSLTVAGVLVNSASGVVTSQATIPIASGGTGGTTGAVLLTGAQTVAGVKTFSSTLTSTAGIAVGGALTGATTGAFSGALSAAGVTSSAGVAAGGPISGAGLITSTVPYGSIVMTFPSGASSGFTDIGATSGNSAGGVTGSLLHIDNHGAALLVAVDTTGNLGIAGQVYAANYNIVSLAAMKDHVQDTGINALGIVQRTAIKRWSYKSENVEHAGDATHIGPIADDVHPTMLSSNGEGISIPNSLFVLMQAVQMLAAKVEALEAR